MEVTRTFDLLTQLKEKYAFKQDILSIRTHDGWVKYSVDDYYRISHQLAYGMLAAGFQEGDRVVIITQNRPEWNFLDMALSLAHMISIPVYPTLSEEDYRHILNHSGARAVFVGNEKILGVVGPLVEEMPLRPELFTVNEIEGRKNWKELLKLGEEKADEWAPVIEGNKKKIDSEEVCTIIYTSGTTGMPKGVMLKHIGLTFNAIGHANMQIRDHRHRMLSFLPLCHIYERSMNYEYQYLGVSIYYAESLRSIARDLNEAHADGFCAVPRVMEMMFDKLQAKGNELKGVSRMIYKWAFNKALKFDYKRKDALYKLPYAIADKLVYSKWREALGGHEMLVVSGGSSIQEKIIRLYTAAKMYIFEGYGMTETSPVIAVNNPKKMLIVIGTVGKIMPGIEMKLADDGEILTKGVCLMAGYYKDPEATAQVIDEEGWFHTGDIGEFNKDGYLRITDRKKEI
ncbi:MAG: AMP-binding protein, partial [Bacteroidales bacterium]|nr:AMP-binding protein [Bacteroidales bacterium]